MAQIVVRNVPSPTGLLHIGTLRTALYNYLFAKKHNGKIVFRSEDTDKERSKIEYEKNIVSGLTNLGMLEPNTEIIRQSERTEIYKEHLQKLLNEGKAYYCFMTQEELEKDKDKQREKGLPPRYCGKYRDFPFVDALKKIKAGETATIRLKIPENKEIVFNDLIRGEISTNTKDLDDFVIAKNLENPLYNFCVVVDDHLMNVTHVIRGEDHIPNTPKQMLLYEAFGFEYPNFAHLPLILNQDKSKLSKRKNKVSVDNYLEEGYLPEALLNFLVLLGWNPGTEEEFFTLNEMIDRFSLERVHKGGAIFNLEKLVWINGHYIRNLNIDDFKKRLTPFLKKTSIYKDIQDRGEEYLYKVIASVKEKLKKLSEIEEQIIFFYKTIPATKELIINEKMKVDENVAKKAIITCIDIINKINEKDYKADLIKDKLLEKIKEFEWKNGQMLWPLRASLTGTPASPGAFEVSEILGKNESLNRLNKSLSIFNK